MNRGARRSILLSVILLSAAWAAFGADPEWVKTRTAMQVNVQVENVFMSATDYSPMK